MGQHVRSIDPGKIARLFEKGDKEEGGSQTTEKGNLKQVGHHLRSMDHGHIEKKFPVKFTLR